jgi:hypothetical protein
MRNHAQSPGNPRLLLAGRFDVVDDSIYGRPGVAARGSTPRSPRRCDASDPVRSLRRVERFFGLAAKHVHARQPREHARPFLRLHGGPLLFHY